jgi:hypothetical protein
MIAHQKATVGLATGGDAQRTRFHPGTESRPTLAEAGIDQNLAHRARRSRIPSRRPAPATAMWARRGSRPAGRSAPIGHCRYRQRTGTPLPLALRCRRFSASARRSRHRLSRPSRSAARAARVPARSARPECCTSPASCRRWRRPPDGAGVATADDAGPCGPGRWWRRAAGDAGVATCAFQSHPRIRYEETRRVAGDAGVATSRRRPNPVTTPMCSEGQSATRALRHCAGRQGSTRPTAPIKTARSANGLRYGFRGVVVDNQPWPWPIGQDRLREEFAQHVARQPPGRAVDGLCRLLGLRAYSRGQSLIIPVPITKAYPRSEPDGANRGAGCPPRPASRVLEFVLCKPYFPTALDNSFDDRPHPKFPQIRSALALHNSLANHDEASRRSERLCTTSTFLSLPNRIC